MPQSNVSAKREAVVCATRRSKLALTQSRHVAALLAERGIATTLLGLVTTGDRDQQTPLDKLGSVNVFVTELENAIREGRADYAVHSCKDLAATLAEDLRIAAVSRREDPRDAFCSDRYASFEALPSGAVIGTSSLRRRVQLEAIRPDVTFEAMRGNVDTRLGKLAEGRYDAIVLAMAGLVRLKTGARYVVPFDVGRVVPAAGQGALAIETRAGDERLIASLRAAVNDSDAELCIACERAVLRAMRAGCSAPLGAHAYARDGMLVVEGVYSPEGGGIVRARREARVETLDAAEALGTEVARQLKEA